MSDFRIGTIAAQKEDKMIAIVELQGDNRMPV
jgi:hypothetical protein